MRILAVATVLAPVLLSAAVFAGEVSVQRGLYVSVIGGCHDCHTEGYAQSQGVIDPEKALKGSTLGWQGPWGTSYATNLRLTASDLPEDGYVRHILTLQPLPPMPGYNVRQMAPDDVRSLYLYIRSLGEPGERAPMFVSPGERVKTNYVVLDPPQPPPPCTRDLDCGVGEVCGSEEPRQCVKR